MKWVHLAFGAAFGAVLTLSGAADFDKMALMLRFSEFHLFGMALITTAVTFLGLRWLRSRTVSLSGCPVASTERPLHRGVVPGAVVFGIGWGVSGSCPGTALVHVGEGRLIALATVAGIFCGVALQRVVNERVLRWRSTTCE